MHPENYRKGCKYICRKAWEVFLSLSSAHVLMSPQNKGEGHFHRIQVVLKKSQFSEDWHFSDGNEQFEFVLEGE